MLRFLAHGFVAGLGGSLLAVAGFLVLSLPEIFPRLGLPPILLAVLLVLVGGPLSLFYLWPMITDPDQRPTATAFTWRGETTPWTKRSVTVAVLAGVVVVSGLTALGVPFDAVFALVVLAVFSPVIVSLFTTVGSIESDRLVCNGTGVALRQVAAVRSLRIGSAVVYWISYAPGTGVLAPRLITVPAGTAGAVRSELERGVGLEPDRPRRDPLVGAVLGVTGLLFVGVAGLAVLATDDPVLGSYFGGVLGGIGVLLWVAAWRGV